VKTVSVSDLKANLSRYLREVRRGGEVQVLDRGVPVARLVGVGRAPRAEADRRDRLVRGGLLRPGAADAAKVLARPPLALPTRITAALDEERADRL
jgi:prevent-host-death family protein